MHRLLPFECWFNPLSSFFIEYWWNFDKKQLLVFEAKESTLVMHARLIALALSHLHVSQIAHFPLHWLLAPKHCVYMYYSHDVHKKWQFYSYTIKQSLSIQYHLLIAYSCCSWDIFLMKFDPKHRLDNLLLPRTLQSDQKCWKHL